MEQSRSSVASEAILASNCKVDSVLSELLVFILVVEKSNSLAEAQTHSLESQELVDYTIAQIQEHLEYFNANSDLSIAIAFLKAIESKLIKYFKSVSLEEVAFNLKELYKDPVKYNYRSNLYDSDALYSVFGKYASEDGRFIYSKLKENYNEQDFSLRHKFKLPSTGIEVSEIIIVLDEIKIRKLEYEFLSFVFKDYRTIRNSARIKRYLEKFLSYDIAMLKNHLLWPVLGFTLYEHERLESSSKALNYIFIREDNFDQVILFLESNRIVDIDGKWLGIPIKETQRRGEAAHLVALAHFLVSQKSIKAEFTISEIVTYLGKQYNISLSTAAKTKKSKFHDQLISYLKEHLILR
jgi:hypothetical protein